MAWIKAFGAPASAKHILFKNGTLGASILNPGGLYYNNENTRSEGYDIGTNITNHYTAGKFYNLIAFLDLNFSDISAINIKYTGTANIVVYRGTITSGNVSALPILTTLYPGTDVTQVIDVSSVTGVNSLYLALTNNNATTTITEITYE